MNDLSVGPYQILGSQVSHLITLDIIDVPTYLNQLKLNEKKSINERYRNLKKKEPPKCPPAVDLQKLYFCREFIESDGNVDPTAVNFYPHEVKAKRKFGEKIKQMLSESKLYLRENENNKEKSNPEEVAEGVVEIPMEPIKTPSNELLDTSMNDVECDMVKAEEELKEKPLQKSTFIEDDTFGIWPEFDNEDDKFEFLKRKLENMETTKRRL